MQQRPPERIAPGKPQQNGRLERLHLALVQDTANPAARGDPNDGQRRRQLATHAL